MKSYKEFLIKEVIKILPSFDKDDYLCHYGTKGQKKALDVIKIMMDH